MDALDSTLDGNAPSLDAVDSMDPTLLSGDPHPYFTRLRAEAPVYRDPHWGFVSVATYDLVEEVLRKPQLFSSDMSGQYATALASMDPEELRIMADGLPNVNTMLTADPPAHTRYKKLAIKAFTYKRVEQMGAYVSEVTNSLIDRFIEEGGCEFKHAFADLLPSIVIADALGIGRADVETFQTWLRAAVVRLGGVMSDKAARLDAARKALEMQHYFVEQIALRRREPRDDVISDLAHATLAEEGDPRRLDDAEIISILTQIFVAGQETTAHALTAALYYLLTHPDQLAAVRRDPAMAADAIEETLRFLTPVNNMWRTVAQDTELGGVTLTKGEMLFLRFGSANRDEQRFSDPHAFDISRPNAKEHLAFGGGIHACLGAQLARKEMSVALPILLERLQGLRLADDGNTFRYAPSPLLRGVLELHVRFEPGMRRGVTA